MYRQLHQNFSQRTVLKTKMGTQPPFWIHWAQKRGAPFAPKLFAVSSNDNPCSGTGTKGGGLSRPTEIFPTHSTHLVPVRCPGVPGLSERVEEGQPQEPLHRHRLQQVVVQQQHLQPL